MDKLRINGGNALNGTVELSGAKNAALPILFSTLLTNEKCELTRVPKLQDIRSTLALLLELGVESRVDLNQHKVVLKADHINSYEASYDLVRKMRASVLVLGPLLARFGQAKVSLPGGCAIGARPVDFHIKGFKKLGAEIEIDKGYIVAHTKDRTSNRLIGNKIKLDFPSVGATENLLMGASLAKGETLIENAAKEPEVIDLANALKSMGAIIEGEGSDRILIQGVENLKGLKHEIIGDRIEAGTFLAAALMTGGCITVNGIDSKHLESVLEKFTEAGGVVQAKDRSITLKGPGRPKSTDLHTDPYPGFPTDMQAQFMAAMSIAEGKSVITETIFENRFMHVSELMRMGAEVKIQHNTAIINGVKELTGAPVMATDLRASASLVLGALAAKGETIISRIYHLDRGYECMEEKLRSLGAEIERCE